jgi:hypothetical protein
MVTEIQLLESPDPSPSDFCLCGWMKGEVYRRKVDMAVEMLAHILDAAARIQKREDQRRRKTRVAKCTEDGGGITLH